MAYLKADAKNRVTVGWCVVADDHTGDGCVGELVTPQVFALRSAAVARAKRYVGRRPNCKAHVRKAYVEVVK